MEELISNFINNINDNNNNDNNNNKQEILVVCDFYNFRNRMNKNYTRFLDYLQKNLLNFNLIYYGNGLPNFKFPNSIFNIINDNCKTNNPILFFCDDRGVILVNDVDKYDKNIKILDYEDIADKEQFYLREINKNKYDYVLYKCDNIINNFIKMNCPNSKYIYIDHYIDDTIFKDYQQNKEIDILCYGCIDWGYYPFRKRLFELLPKSKFNVMVLEHPSYDAKTKHDFLDEKLSQLINKSKITIVTPSILEVLLKKYTEVALSKSCMAGRLPKQHGEKYNGCIIELNENMSDNDIINKIEYYLNDDKKMEELVEKAYQVAIDNYTYEKGCKKYSEILTFKNIDKYIDDNKKIDIGQIYEKNQNVDIVGSKIIAKQTTSTPGIRIQTLVSKFTNYKIYIRGYKECDTEVRLWIGNISGDTILFSEEYQLNKENKITECKYNNKNYNNIYIGLLFRGDIKIGDSFYLHFIKIMEDNEDNKEKKMQMQIQTSYSIKYFHNKFKERYDVIDYNNCKKPVIFFGLYDENDFDIIRNHKDKCIIIFGGTDVLMLREWNDIKIKTYLRNDKYSNKFIYGIPIEIYNVLMQPNIKYISISDFITNELLKINIKSEQIILSFTNNDLYKPVEKGNNVYIYTSKNFPDIYGAPIYESIIKKIPHINFIKAYNGLYDDVYEVYKKCFIGLRLTKHDGNANTVQELGLCGIKCVHNSNYPNAIRWETEDDIIKVIEEEYKTVGQIDEELSNKMKEFLKTDDKWLTY